MQQNATPRDISAPFSPPSPPPPPLPIRHSRAPPVIPAEAGIHPPSPSPSRRGNPCGCPFPARTRFHPFARPPVIPAEAGIHPPSPSPSRRGNPCGCPFPAPTRFHPFARPWSFLRRACPVPRHGAGIHPLPSAPHPSFPRPTRHSCEGRNPSSLPVVGATLVVARSRRQPVFIPLMWPDKAMVIPAEAGIHPLPPPRPLR